MKILQALIEARNARINGVLPVPVIGVNGLRNEAEKVRIGPSIPRRLDAPADLQKSGEICCGGN